MFPIFKLLHSDVKATSVRYLGVIVWIQNLHGILIRTSYVSKKATKVCTITCIPAVLLQNKRLLGHFWFLFWIILVLGGIHILTKTLLPLNEFKTVVLTGFVGQDFVLVLIDGLNHLKNVVQSYFGYFFREYSLYVKVTQPLTLS